MTLVNQEPVVLEVITKPKRITAIATNLILTILYLLLINNCNKNIQYF